MEEARDKAYAAAIGNQVEYIHEDDTPEWCTVTDMEIGEYSTLLVLQTKRGPVRVGRGKYLVYSGAEAGLSRLLVEIAQN
ncbi:MAG: hypothetical protein C4331_08060 [Meiothermus sp.]